MSTIHNIDNIFHTRFSLVEKYINKENVDDFNKIKRQYYRILLEANLNIPYINTLINHYSINEHLVEIAKKLDIYNEYKKIPKYDTTEKLKEELCQCGKKFLDLYQNELICESCGAVKYNGIPVGLSDKFVSSKEGMQFKNPSYERTKHGEKWLSLIQGKCTMDVPNDVINDVKKQLYIDGISNKSDITYSIMRKCLSKTNHSKFYDHIPYIKYHITKESPPMLSTKEIQKILKWFSIVLDIFEKRKDKKKKNCPYYPYFIRKLLEQKFILSEDTKEQYEKKCKIISNMHLQSPNTIRQKDQIWRMICSEIKKFQYYPTDIKKYKL